MSQNGVLLARDGVINKIIFRDGKPTSPRNIGEFEFEEGVEPAHNRLSAIEFKLFVLTNQPSLTENIASATSSVDIIGSAKR
jgi:histidinol phosphatase-like enzyme